MKDLTCFLCSPCPTDEDHFSPEADAAVSEMTRGAVLVAQVQHMSGEALLLVVLLVSTALHSVLHKTQRQSLPSRAPEKSWGWELPSALLGTGKGLVFPLVSDAGRGREPATTGPSVQQIRLSWAYTALPVLTGFTPWPEAALGNW